MKADISLIEDIQPKDIQELSFFRVSDNIYEITTPVREGKEGEKYHVGFVVNQRNLLVTFLTNGFARHNLTARTAAMFLFYEKDKPEIKEGTSAAYSVSVY